jgi:hypothetical protein
VVHERARELVEDDQLAAAGRDGEGVAAEHAVDLVAAQAGRVDEPAGGHGAVGRREAEAAADALDPGHRSVPAELAAREHGLGSERQGRRERADDRLVRHLEGCSRAGGEVRLALVQLGGVELADRVVAVGVRALDDAWQLLALLVIPGDEQGASAFQRDADARGVLGQQLATARDETRLERAGLGVEAGVEQGGVRLACAGADVQLFLEKGHIEVEASELAGDRRADHAGPDDYDVPVHPAATLLRACGRTVWPPVEGSRRC